MATLNIPARTLAIGQTTIEGALGNISITGFAATLDFSGWVLPASLDFDVYLSFDNAASYEIAGQVGGLTKPPWFNIHGVASTAFKMGVNYSVVRQPTNVRVVINVSGNSIPLGNSTLTLS